ncbi:hypothetical protein MCUN1_000393 [Malassezia cuniculi]|uniref:Uncharacterized protein n=1 Tax=Malassezia cuniculi TaxID=948313 RepID=A0AAF0ENX0_9BASI|nr:hypothetical protein MCUN1_000393 [Malassezia cuniculi]
MLPPSSPEATPRLRAPRITLDSPARFEGPEPAWVTNPDSDNYEPPSPPRSASWIRRLPPLSDDELALFPSNSNVAGLGLAVGLADNVQRIPPASSELDVPATPHIGSQADGRFPSVSLPPPVTELVDRDHPDAYIPDIPIYRPAFMKRENAAIFDDMPMSSVAGLGLGLGLGAASSDTESLNKLMHNVKIGAPTRRAFGARPLNMRSKSIDLGMTKFESNIIKAPSAKGDPYATTGKDASLPAEMLDENGKPKILHSRRASTSTLNTHRSRSTMSGGAMSRDRTAFAVASSVRRRDAGPRPAVRALR